MRNIPRVEDCVIIHCHPRNCVAYMGIGYVKRQMSTIKEFFPELNLNIAKNVPLIQAGTKELASSIEQLFFHDCYFEPKYRNDIIGLENHGVISCADSFEKAYDNISQLEYYCSIHNKSPLK